MKKPLFTLVLSFLLASGIMNAQQWPGYTLYATSGGTTAILCDTNGTAWHTWSGLTGNTGYSSYLMPGGILWRTVTASGNSLSGGGMTGRVQKVDFNGAILWDYTYSSTTYCLHHDICPMANGNVLVISYDVKSASEVTAAGSSFSGAVWSEKVMELKPTGATGATVVWEWKVWDHVVQNTNASGANYQSSIVNHPELLNLNYKAAKDWMHMNGIDYNPVLDQITVSSHNLNEWYVIDHSTTTAEAASHAGGNAGHGGDFLYRWGNPAAYGATGTAILNVTHDAHWIPEGCPNAGRLVGFNNKGVSSSQSSVDQVTPVMNGYNYTFGTPTTYTQRHACNGYSSNMGNSQQLPNGNMLVCIATAGNIYEIDPAGNSIWTKSAGGTAPQAFRYDVCYVNQAAPAIPTITLNGSDLQSSTAVSYQWYLNGVQIAGATNQTYTPTQNGVYLVKVTDSNGCMYSYSVGYKYTGANSVNDLNLSNAVNIFPNPTTGVVNIDNKIFAGKEFEVTVYDALGKKLINEKNVFTLDLSGYESGLYFMSATSEGSVTVNKKISVVK